MKLYKQQELNYINQLKNISLDRIPVKTHQPVLIRQANLSEQHRYTPYDSFMSNEDLQNSIDNKCCVVINEDKKQQAKNVGITHDDIKICKNFNKLNFHLPLNQNHHVSLPIGSNKAQRSGNKNMNRQKRAKQFITLITKEKTRYKGEFFILKQAEEERRRLKTQFEACEKKILMNHFKQQRVKAAIEKIKMFEKRAHERQKLSRLSHSGKKSLDQFLKNDKQDINRVIIYKQKRLSNNFTKSGDQSIQMFNNRKFSRNNKQLKNQVYIKNEEQRTIQQTRKKLIQLSKIIDKKQKLASHYF